ncbi:hypothetical protein [Lysobacter humi (ex Lee et al. 2017)]
MRLPASLLALLLVVAGIPSMAQARAPQALPGLDSASVGLKSLGPAQKQALVMLVGMRVTGRSAGLPRGDAASAARSMKIVSLENLLMASLARDAGWPAMQRYYEDAAALGARNVRGELQGAAALREARALEDRRRTLMRQAFAKANAAKISPQDPKLNTRADRIAAEIARRARDVAR